MKLIHAMKSLKNSSLDVGQQSLAHSLKLNKIPNTRTQIPKAILAALLLASALVGQC
jgi:hypothetical protein